jgi:hypothetical protein
MILFHINFNDSAAVCIPKGHTGSMDADHNHSKVHRILKKLVEFGICVLFVVVEARFSRSYCMLYASPYIV